MKIEGRVDGAPRKDHYGAGRQPWDDIVDQGWGPEFAAGNVLKYLRRPNKVPAGLLGPEDTEGILESTRAHSIESARWYYDRLYKMACNVERARACLVALRGMLTVEERVTLDVREARRRT